MNSLIIGVPTAFFSMALGTLAALAVSRGGLRSAGIVSILVVAPMMLPHVILAIGLYPVLLKLGLLASQIGGLGCWTGLGSSVTSSKR